MSSLRQSWLPVATSSDFSLYNLPFGIFKGPRHSALRVGVALGNDIIDLGVLAHKGLFKDLDLEPTIFEQQALNTLFAKGKTAIRRLRLRLMDMFDAQNKHKLAHLDTTNYTVAQKDATMALPVHIGDYTDFYSSLEHASNVGSMFRDPQNPLLPNWRHIPVAYHGRSSSIYISDTPIVRPCGQRKPPNVDAPVFSASKQMDFELETAFITCTETQASQRISVNDAEEHIIGMCLFNDWSARDIQAWEYVPLGPFLGKNFASTISPWIVTLDALEPFRCAGPKQNPRPLPYLQTNKPSTFDIQLKAHLRSKNQDTLLCQTNFKYLYWNMRQQLAHHTINGCKIRIGDCFASGTISGKTPSSFGSMLELSWRGQKPLTLKDGSQRSFLEDNDTLILSGYAEKENIRVGFGEAKGTILPAKPY